MITVKNLKFEYISYELDQGFLSAIKDLFSRKYIKNKVLDIDKIEIKKGEIVGVLGPNGAGKTTLIKLLTGILENKKGEIICNNEIPYMKNKNYLKNIGVVLGQKSQLIWDLPPIETLKMLKEIYSIPTNDFDSRLTYLLKLLNLENKKNIPVRKLSLGERLKFELICSLIQNPKILFLDEPTIGIDLISQYAIYDFLKEINKTYKTTIILTSHYMKDIENLCNRVIVLIKGEKKIDLPIKELKNMFKTTKKYIVETKDDILPFSFRNASYKRVDENKYEIYFEDDKYIIENINLNDIVSIREDVVELEEIIFNLYKEQTL